MRTIPVVLSALLVAGLPAGVSAQAAPEAVPPSAPASAASSSNTQFGLNLNRIQRGLRKSSERQEYDGLNLRYYVNVFAPAPPINLFTKQDNLAFGPAPYGGPTHGEIMRLITPQEHSAPAADFSGIARWFANKGKK
jgi:hypothetical protein